MTYTLIDSVTLGSSASSVTFSSISQDYGDLVLVCEVKSNVSKNLEFRVNGDTGDNYKFVRATGNGSTASSGSGSSIIAFICQDDANATKTVHSRTEFLDYASTDKHKTTLTRSGTSRPWTEMIAHRWANTNAITSISLGSLTADSWLAGSTFYLYGIEA